MVDELCRLLDGAALVPAARGLRSRLWWATGSAAGVDAATERQLGVITARPGADADLARYWTRTAGEPRVAAFRIADQGEEPGALVGRWLRDPVRVWATQLVAQTLPMDAEIGAHLATLRGVAAAVGAAPPVSASVDKLLQEVREPRPALRR